MLSGRKIILGVSGSIAAYKAVFLTRLFVKEGAEVQVIMTKDAASFVAPLTFSTLSKQKVIVSLWNEEEVWNDHVALGQWADLFLIAPATANTIAKMANGICDNALTATYLSARCPVVIAPAMDVDMWKHKATQRNIDQLKKDGVRVLSVGKGELASGLEGEGRMMEPEQIITEINHANAAK